MYLQSLLSQRARDTVAVLCTKYAQRKGDRDALIKKQLVVHRITSADTNSYIISIGVGIRSRLDWKL